MDMTRAEKEELEQLKQRLEEAEDTLRAINEGEVDAVVAKGSDGRERLYTLHGAESPYRHFLEQMKEGAATISSKGTILFCNRSFAEIFGVGISDILGEHLNCALPPEAAAIVEQLTIGALPTVTEMRLPAPNGALRPMRLSISRVEEDGEDLFSLVIIDLTEREALREALQAEKHARNVLNSLHTMAAVLTPEGRVVEANHALLRVSELNAEDVNGKLLQDTPWCSYSAESRESAVSMIARAAAGETVFTDQCIYAKDRCIDTELALAPMRNERGEVTHLILSGTDITLRKQAEQELRAANDAAEESRKAAVQANAAKDEFLAVLSHEIRTPLAPILGAVQLLQRSENLSPKGNSYLQTIRRNLDLETRLIDDLLDLTRIVRGKIVLERTRLNVCTALDRVAEICRPEVEAKKLILTLDVDESLEISADVSRLQQIFWNLFKNAVKFTPEGGSVRITGWREDSRAIVEVADTGIGIAPEELSRIFEPFEQGGTRRNTRFGGLGLGLTITRRLVELHGGSVSVSSPGKGKGAVFRVTLPLLQDDVAEEEIASSGACRFKIQGPRRILLVEDHEDTAFMMQTLLESSGYEVQTAKDVKHALQAAETGRFDLVVSDLGLPDGNGRELLRKLRERKDKITGIALSGYGREEDIKSSKEAGFSAHLTKPVDFDALLSLVEKLI